MQKENCNGMLLLGEEMKELKPFKPIIFFKEEHHFVHDLYCNILKRQFYVIYNEQDHHTKQHVLPLFLSHYIALVCAFFFVFNTEV